MLHLLCLLIIGSSYVRVPTKSAVPALPTNLIWVFFTDKGIYSDAQCRSALDVIDLRAQPELIARRRNSRVRGFDFDDLPVRASYVREIEALGARLRSTSSWLNAASFYLPDGLAPQVYSLPFVYDLKPVITSRRAAEPVFPLSRIATDGKSGTIDTAEAHRFYGPSYDQAQMMGVPEVRSRGHFGAGVRLAIFDTGLKMKHRAVSRMHIWKQHDFLSGDNAFVTGSGFGWTPAIMPNARFLGLVKDPALLVQQQTSVPDATPILLTFVADLFDYRFDPPNRGVFACYSTDKGASWSRPVGVDTAERPFDATFERTAMLSNRTTNYLAYNSLTRADPNPAATSVYLGYFADTTWQNSVQWVGAGRAPALAARSDTLYLAYVRTDSILVLRLADITQPRPLLIAGEATFSALEMVTDPQVAVDGNVVRVFATGTKSGRLLHFRSTDGGRNFEAGTVLASEGMRAVRLAGNGQHLFLFVKTETGTAFDRLRVLRSADAGATWSAPTDVTTGDIPIGGFACNNSTSDPVVLYETGGVPHRAWSSDSGATWSVSGPLDTAGFCYMPVMADLDTNQVAVWFKRGDDNTVWEESDTARFSPKQPDHGTRMASLIAGYQQGAIVGIAPAVDLLIAKTELYAVRTGFPYEFGMEEDTYIQALEWAENAGADIVSTSLGYRDWYSDEQFDGKTAPVSIAADLAARRGMVVVTAMGNRDTSEARFWWPNPYIVAPGDAEGVITAGGVQKTGAPWQSNGTKGGSGTGPTSDGRVKPDLVALSDTVTVIDPDSLDYLSGSAGTSCATALIAGACALVKEIHPQWTADSIKAVLFATATRSVKSCTFGFGVPRVDSVYKLYPPGPDMPDFKNDQIGLVFPNPFVPKKHQRLYFQINLMQPAPEGEQSDTTSPVSISIFTTSGALIRRLELDTRSLGRPGRYGDYGDTVRLDSVGAFWDGRNKSGRAVASGLYLAVLQTTFGRHVAKFALVRED